MQVSYYQGTHLRQVSTSVANTANLIALITACKYQIIHVKAL